MTSATKRKKMGWLERHFTFVMCVPLLITGVIVLAYPLVEIVRISFYKWSILLGGIPEFAGISQYVRILKDQRFLNSVRVTLYFTGGALAISMILGIGTALLLQRISKGRKLIISLLLLPFLACPMATGLIWKQMYEPSFSVFNFFLRIAHLPTSAWVFSSKAVIPSIILWDVWWGTPYVVVIVLGGLIMLPKEFFEQATIDGASPFQMFRYVTLPLITPTLLVALVLRVIATLKVFAPIYAMTEGGPGLSSESLYFYTYQLFTYGRIGYSAAVAIALFLLILVISIFLLRIMRGSR